MSTRYARGDKAWGICQRSGKRALLKDLIFDGRFPNLRVLPDWYEPRDPVDNPVDLKDPVALWRPSPEDGPIPPVLTGEAEEGDNLLTWTQGDPNGHARFETYKLYRAVSTDEGATFSDYALVFIGTVLYDTFMAITFLPDDYEDTAVTEGTLYRYYVVAADANGRGVNSNVIELTGVVEPPLVVNPEAPVLSGEESEGGFQLSWTAAVIGSAPIDFYRLYRSVDGGAFALLYQDEALDLQYLDLDIDFLTADTYDYRAAAYATDGGVSPDSNTVSFEEPEVTDPLFGQVVLLLHLDGSDGSTVFIDSSTYAHTVSASGGASLGTDDPKFGTASLALLNGSAQVSAAPGDELDLFAAGDFTIEGWFKTPLPGAFKVVLDYGDFNAGGGIRLYTNGAQLTVQTSAFNAWSDITNNNVPIQADTWHFFAIVRQGTLGRLYVDGIADSIGVANWSWAPGDSALFDTIFIGQSPNSVIQDSFWPGRIDEVRVTQAARYTANFTPPALPFPDA